METEDIIEAQQAASTQDQTEAEPPVEPSNDCQPQSDEAADNDSTDSSSSDESDYDIISYESRIPSLVQELVDMFSEFSCSSTDQGPCLLSRELQRSIAEWGKEEVIEDDDLTHLLDMVREYHCTHMPVDAQTLYYMVEYGEESLMPSDCEE